MDHQLEISRRRLLLGSVGAAALLWLGPRRAQAATGDLIAELSLIETVAAIKGGKFSAAEYTSAMLDRGVRHRHLKAFITQMPEVSMAQAKTVDAVLAAGRDPGAVAGAALALKDNIDTADMPTSAGTPALKNNLPAANAPVAQALLDAGGVLIGKANMHELAFGITSNNATFGAVGNPYDPKMIPGGSSGGTAAAVAARLATAGLGSDTGGSVRIPAALCGIVGFRPTLMRYAQAGVVPISSTRDTTGPMTRSVDDAILIDSVCAGDRPPRHEVALTGLRLGVPRAFFYHNLDGEHAAVIEQALTALRGAGVELVEADLPEIEKLNQAVGFPVALYEVLRELSAYLYLGGNRMSVLDIVDQVAGAAEKGILMSQLERAKAVPAAAYQAAMASHRPALQGAYADYFARHRVAAMVVPTTPLPARPIGHEETVELNGEQVPTFLTYIRNTDPPSNAGLPCLSVSAGLTAGGLPVGIELVGPAGSDATVLGIGRAYEALRAPLPPPRL